ncbi:MAG: response regulator [Candidatus Obscuribacterales bacterium]|nr:response regulator [Candidatus Obscuribacterales bacterium]
MNSPLDAHLNSEVVSVDEASGLGRKSLTDHLQAPADALVKPAELAPVAEPDYITKMLVVDDLPVNRKLIGIQLLKLGCQVDHATNGLEAVEKVLAEDFGLVFMDLDMPGMDGYQAAIAIRQHDVETAQHTPIIAVTSYEHEEERQKCVSSGMDAYIFKGVSAKKLSEIVQRYRRVKRVLPRLEAGTATPKENGVEIDIELLQSSDESAQIGEIIDISVGTMKTLIACLKCAVEDRDIDSVVHFAQSFKAPCAKLGLNSTARLAVRIWADAESSGWVNAEEGVVLLESQYSQVLEQLTGPSAELHRADLS